VELKLMYRSIVSNGENGRRTRTMAWYGRTELAGTMKVHLTNCGGIVLEGVDGYIYGDQAGWLSKAVREALDEHKARCEEARRQWFIDNGDKTVHDGFAVDLSINQTNEILKKAVGGMVEHEGIWWKLARTDLKDDVCTTQFGSEGERDYTKNVRYGARLKRHADGRHTFAIVDAWSDG
jgi:hypothetical protein